MRVHEYLRILVINSKIITYEYFMDDITENEIIMLLPIASESYRDAWERTRYSTYYNAVLSGNLKPLYAKKSMTSLFPLPYDNNIPGEEHRYDITNEEIEEMRKRSARVAEILYKKKDDKEQNG